MYFSNISKEEFKEFSDHSSMKTFMQTEEVAMLREKMVGRVILLA